MSVTREAAAKTKPARRGGALSAGRATILVFVCLVAMLPALLQDAMVGAHDTHHHLRWQLHFAELLWGGLPYPRWLPEVNEGFGSPVFFIYPPLAHYVGALFRPLLGGPEGVVLRVALSAWIALVAGGWGVAFWLREREVGPDARLIASLAYVLAPYHLYADTYLRGALAELWAFAPFPFILGGIAMLSRARLRGLIATALAVAALVLSHAPSLLIVLPAACLYALLLAAVERRWTILPLAAGGLLLGLALAAPYLATALTQGSLIASWNLFDDYFRPSRWLLGSGDAWPSPDVGLPILAAASVQVGVATVLWFHARNAGRLGADRLFAVLLLLGTIALTTEIGRPFWTLDTPLNRIQFPWRLLLLQTVPLALLAAQAADRSPARRHWLPIAAVLALGFTNVTLSDRVLSWRTAPVEIFDWAAYYEPPEYILGDPWVLSTVFANGARTLTLDGSARVAVSRWDSRRVVLRIDAEAPAKLALRQFGYSGWRYRVDGEADRQASIWSDERPVPVIEVPEGRHDVVVWMPPLPGERLGWVCGGLALALLCGLGLAFGRRSRKP